jgi:type I restriction enzyme S subunit
LDEQRRIVAELEKQFSRLDEAVANLKRVKVNLKRYKAAVLSAAFTGKLVPSSDKDGGVSSDENIAGAALLVRILEVRRTAWDGRGVYREPTPPFHESRPELPFRWVWATADQLTSLITDGEHLTPKRTEHGVLLLSARNVQNGSLALDDVDYIPIEEYERIARRLEVRPGDVLLSCSGSVGRSCVVPSGLRFALVRSVAVLRPLVVVPAFLSYQIESPICQSQIDDKKTETAQANIFQGKIRQLVFALPPLAEQRRIVAEVDRRLSIVRGVEAEVEANLKRAQALRQAVLAKAFSPGA